MDPDSSLLLSILLLVVLISVNAFFAMSEIAIISLNDAKIKKMAQEGNKKARIIERLTREPSKFLATIQVGVTLSGFLASAVAADRFAGYVVKAFSGTSFPAETVHGVALVAITLLLSYITLVFGELVPKRVAMQHYERISFAIAKLISLISLLTKPFVWLLSVSTNAILRLLRIDPNSKPDEVTEEEIRMMIDVGGESGTIEQSEKDMLNNIFEFDDTTAGDIMTHRTEITSIDLDTPLEEIVAIALESGHSRIPVCDEDLDTIVGMLYVKDLLELVRKPKNKAFDLRSYMRKPMYVPESIRSDALLSEFKQKKIQVAIVVDEYGGTSGLVSMEDVLEEIVGNIQDEYDDEEEEITPLGDGKYLINGLTAIDDVLKLFDLDIADEDDYDTIGGYVINELGFIPGEDEHPSICADNIRLTVQSVEERRIAKLLAEVLPKPAEEDDDEDDD